MKKFLLLILLHIFNVNYLWSKDSLLGEETIDRIRFPKFYFMYGHGVLGKAFDLKNIVNEKTLSKGYYAVGTEHNLYKYMNAGFKVSFFMDKLDLDVDNSDDNDLTSYKLNLNVFAKPFIPITDIVAFYTKFGGGFGNSFKYPTNWLTSNSIKNYKVYRVTYQDGTLPSINGTISLGMDYFPFSRFGVFLESTYLTELNFASTKFKKKFTSAASYIWFINQSVLLSGGLSFVF